MTTIAYRNGIMAGDTQASFNSTCIGESIKIRKGNNGNLYGFSGSIVEADEAFEFLQDDTKTIKKPIKFTDNETFYTIIEVIVTGAVFIYEGTVDPIQFKAPFYAQGSGSDLALGAMAAGASAEEAVKIACKYNIYSSEPVTIISLNEDWMRI